MFMARKYIGALTLLALSLSSPVVNAASSEVARQAYERKDYATALREWQEIAEAGFPFAQNALGTMYENGQGVIKDDQKAVEYYRLSAERGDAIGQRKLGTKYYFGKGVKTDYSESIKWWRLAAAQGDAKAQMNLGASYFAGEGAVKNYVIAYALMSQAIPRLEQDDAYTDANNAAKSHLSSSEVELAEKLGKELLSHQENFLSTLDMMVSKYGNYNVL